MVYYLNPCKCGQQSVYGDPSLSFLTPTHCSVCANKDDVFRVYVDHQRQWNAGQLKKDHQDAIEQALYAIISQVPGVIVDASKDGEQEVANGSESTTTSNSSSVKASSSLPPNVLAHLETDSLLVKAAETCEFVWLKIDWMTAYRSTKVNPPQCSVFLFTICF